MGFTLQQRASGILTTFWRGDYSLAVARLREVHGREQRIVLGLLHRALTKEEVAVLRRYAKDLF